MWAGSQQELITGGISAMANIKSALLLVGVSLIATGCATPGDRPNQLVCAALGALAGGGAGFVVADDDDDDGAALVGAALGAGIGALVCAPEKTTTTEVATAETTEGDEDGDGVWDSADKCPGTPRGVAV